MSSMRCKDCSTSRRLAERTMRGVLVSLLMLAYPLLVYVGLARFEPRVLALLLAPLLL